MSDPAPDPTRDPAGDLLHTDALNPPDALDPPDAGAPGEEGGGGRGSDDAGITCDLCGAPMLERHCKLICVRCGYQRDCSDP